MKWKLACTLAAIIAVPAAAQTIQVELVIEAFDGSGCTPSNPPICPEPADLDGSGCNCHDGSTNNPHPTYCSQAGWPNNYPNPSVFGPRALDENWWNQGWAVNYFGSNSVKNGVEPENQGSQSGRIDSPHNVLFQPNPWPASANIGYISPEDPQRASGGFGRILIEQIRQEYNANNPGDLKPAPIPGMPVKLLYDILRNGDGSNNPDPNPQDPALRMRADQIGVWYQPIPASATWTDTPAATRMIPADGQWHTYEIGEWADFPEAVYFGIGIEMTVDSYPYTIPSGQVTFYIDNVRIVYEAIAPDEICDNGNDDDGDGLTDCDDPDCDGHPACPCNPIIFADFDQDLDVDQKDFAKFQLCFTGPGFGDPLSAECACFDATGATPGVPDGSIDQLDFTAFVACSSGPDIAANSACDD